MNIGLIGLGTIGQATAKVLLERGFSCLSLVKIADIDLKRKRDYTPSLNLLTDDPYEVLNDPNIDVIIELIGGIEPAKTYILKAFEHKKDVVTANKALLSLHLKEIIASAKTNKRRIRFEASVGGGIPIISSITSSLIANKIQKIYGIINGTTNYILTRMLEEKREFFDVLKDAQKEGFAEADPSLDINGDDTLHKLIVLSALAFGKIVDIASVYKEGISEITISDLVYADELGFKIKLLGIAKIDNGNLEMRIHPVMIPKEHLLSSISYNYNGIYVVSDLTGPLLFYGKGAGGYPTSSAVIADVFSLLRGEDMNIPDISNVSPYPIENLLLKSYIRFMVSDKPGVLALISGILAKYKISISSCIQKERGDIVPVVMVTHEAYEGDIRAAIDEIKREDVIKDVVRIRIEEL
ncbi:MAG: homoserine dehydrogenase [bacterium]